MATYTLTQNEDWSDIKASISSDDDVALAGYTLTLDEEPTLTGIDVTTAGTAGAVVISGAYDLSTWSFTAGTDSLIAEVPEGCEVGTITAGTATNAHGCDENNGTINEAVSGTGSSSSGCLANYGTIVACNAGSAGGSYSCRDNYGTITTSNGGSSAGCHGNYRNYGTITTCNGGSGSNGFGCFYNYSTITTCNGGSVILGHGCRYNYGIIATCNGGSASGADGCNVSYGQVLAAQDSTGDAVGEFRGSIKFVDGPNFEIAIVCDGDYDPLQTLYVLNGTFAGTLPSSPDPGYDAEVVELFPIGGGGTPVFGGMVQRRS